MRTVALALVSALAVAGAASAQTVATAQGRDGELAAATSASAAASSAAPVAPGAALTTSQQIDAWLSEAPPSTLASRAGAGPDGPWSDEDAAGQTRFTRRMLAPIDAPPIVRTLTDGQIHGEAGAEIGTLGYGGYGVVSGPLGKNGALQIGVSHYEGWGGDRSRRLGGRYGGGSSTGVSLSASWAPRQQIPDAPVVYTPAPLTPAN